MPPRQPSRMFLFPGGFSTPCLSCRRGNAEGFVQAAGADVKDVDHPVLSLDGHRLDVPMPDLSVAAVADEDDHDGSYTTGLFAEAKVGTRMSEVASSDPSGLILSIPQDTGDVSVDFLHFSPSPPQIVRWPSPNALEEIPGVGNSVPYVHAKGSGSFTTSKIGITVVHVPTTPQPYRNSVRP